MGRQTGSETRLEIRKILKQREAERAQETDSHSKKHKNSDQKKSIYTHTERQCEERDGGAQEERDIYREI